MEAHERGGDQGNRPAQALTLSLTGGFMVLLARDGPGQLIDQPDGDDPEPSLDQPDSHGVLAQHRATERQEERIARRPQGEVRDVSPFDDLVQCAFTNRAGKGPVVFSVGKDADSRRGPTVNVPLNRTGCQHARGECGFKNSPE